MGVGLLMITPSNSLSGDRYATGAKLAAWIESVTPCFVGTVPIEYTEALLDQFAKRYVPGRVVQEAFLILEKRGIRFDFPFDRQIIAPLPPSKTGAPSAPQMRAVSKGEADRIKRYTFEEYEYRYVLAIKTNNAPGAEAILVAVLELLWGMAKGYSRTKQAARHEKVAEWEEFNTAVDEALARARTLRTHVRYLSPEELKSMREAPTPTALRHVARGLATRVTTRTVPPTRRGRK